MASQAQCFYCFECLSSSFENRDPPALSKVEELWKDYQRSLLPEDVSNGQIPEEQHSEEDSATEDTEDTDGEESHDEDNDEDNDITQPSTSLSPSAPRPQLPSISRLQAPTPSSRSSSSSTPSTLSANSSNTALTTTPASSTTSISTSTSAKQHTHPTTYASTLSTTASYPLFVTWNTHLRTNPSQKSLRGCIGTFDPVPLPTGLATYALTSAFEDTRFSPIPYSLLPSLSCNITLLADFENCDHALDWTVGVHGLRIAFVWRGKRYGATYLPHVAVEQGWGREEMLESLMRKSGWDGCHSGHSGGGAGSVARRFLRAGGGQRSDRYLDGAAKPWEEVANFTAVRYTGLKASATYNEWREWRRWVEDTRGRLVLR